MSGFEAQNNKKFLHQSLKMLFTVDLNATYDETLDANTTKQKNGDHLSDDNACYFLDCRVSQLSLIQTDHHAFVD